MQNLHELLTSCIKAICVSIRQFFHRHVHYQNKIEASCFQNIVYVSIALEMHRTSRLDNG